MTQILINKVTFQISFSFLGNIPNIFDKSTYFEALSAWYNAAIFGIKFVLTVSTTSTIAFLRGVVNKANICWDFVTCLWWYKYKCFTESLGKYGCRATLIISKSSNLISSAFLTPLATLHTQPICSCALNNAVTWVS